jgi:phosphoribosyl 1,2-cyclic phosphodiesterase
MTINPLYSSSSGNLFLLEDNNTNILIDVGVSYKKICEALKGLDKQISNLSAVLITHEHTDHIKGLDTFCKNNPNVPIYATNLTANYLRESFNNIYNIIDIYYEETFKINDISITAFETSHDALMPCRLSFK